MNAPSGRKASVRVIDSASSRSARPKSCAIEVRQKTTMKKSNASSVQPRKLARTAARQSLLGIAADARLLYQRGRPGRVTAAAASMERERPRGAQQVDGLVADLVGQVERYLEDRLGAAQAVDDRRADLSHDAALIDAVAVVELVLRPEEAAAARIEGKLRNDPARLSRGGQAGDRPGLEPRPAAVPAQRDLVEVGRLLEDGL